MKLNRIVNKKVLKCILILSIIAAIAYYFYRNKEGFQSRICTRSNGLPGNYYSKNYYDVTKTCKSYGVVCPNGFESGSLNTNDPTKQHLNRCVKNIQMCNDDSDYNPISNTCKDSYSGEATPLLSGAVCSAGIGEERYVPQDINRNYVGSWCQIAKRDNPSCGVNGINLNSYLEPRPLLTFNTTLQKCVFCANDIVYGKGKIPSGNDRCYP